MPPPGLGHNVGHRAGGWSVGSLAEQPQFQIDGVVIHEPISPMLLASALAVLMLAQFRSGQRNRRRSGETAKSPAGLP